MNKESEKKAAVDFANWLVGDDCEFIPSLPDGKGWWVSLNAHDKKLNTDQLFELYLTYFETPIIATEG